MSQRERGREVLGPQRDRPLKSLLRFGQPAEFQQRLRPPGLGLRAGRGVGDKRQGDLELLQRLLRTRRGEQRARQTLQPRLQQVGGQHQHLAPLRDRLGVAPGREQRGGEHLTRLHEIGIEAERALASRHRLLRLSGGEQRPGLARDRLHELAVQGRGGGESLGGLGVAAERLQGRGAAVLCLRQVGGDGDQRVEARQRRLAPAGGVECGGEAVLRLDHVRRRRERCGKGRERLLVAPGHLAGQAQPVLRLGGRRIAPGRRAQQVAGLGGAVALQRLGAAGEQGGESGVVLLVCHFALPHADPGHDLVNDRHEDLQMQ